MPAELASALQELLITVILGVISVLSVAAVSYINVLRKKVVAYIQSIEDEKLRKSLEAAVNKAADLVNNVVTSLEQEEKQEILKAIEDGEVTREELLKLKDIAIDKVVNQLGVETVKLLEDSFGDVVEYIGDLVSSKVFEIKATQGVTYAIEPMEFEPVLEASKTKTKK